MAFATNCPYCRRPMIKSKGRPNETHRFATRDHIMPQEWGGDNAKDNIRPCCQKCNQLRAACGHCVGAMACVLTVARTERLDHNVIAKRWGLLYLATLIQIPRKRRA